MPEVLNAVRECSKFMSGAMEVHMAAMKRVMRYVVTVGKHVSGDSARKPRKSYSEAVTNS
jgi:hypothetical protein